MVPALVKTPILPSVSTTACHMALVYTLLLEASSTWSTRLHNLTQHPSVQSSSTSFLLLTLFRMLTASASLRLCTCHSPWLQCSISIVPALFLHFLQVPAYPITSHRILSDGPIYTAVLPSTLSSLCPESPKNRAGLFPHWALTQDNFIPFWALVFMLSSVTSGQHDGSRWECATFPLSKCRVARAWWGRWGESWWIIQWMSTLLSKIKWQMKLIKVFKLRKILKVLGILGVFFFFFFFLLILINKWTKQAEAK